MPRTQIPLQNLHVRLLKPSARDFDTALEEPEAMQRCELRRGLPFEGRLYLAEPSQAPPPWLQFVETGLQGSIGPITNRSNAAVLLVRASERMFAITFGFGRHRLHEALLVPDFGLRTALNVLSHTSLRALDSLTVEDQTRHTRSQTSRASPLQAFGLDVGRDILRAVTGLPRADMPLHSVSGSESTLALSARTDFKRLGSLCTLLFRVYRRRTYQEHFAWVDNVARVRDPSRAAILDDELVEHLNSGAQLRAYLAPPEPVEWESIRGFNYTYNRGSVESDMQLESYLGAIPPDRLDLDTLTSHKVFVYGLDDEQPFKQWPIYKCLVFEARVRGNAYVLSSGTWYEIDPDFARRIRRSLGAISRSGLRLPPARTLAEGRVEPEAEYNDRAASSSSQLALMDQKLAKCASAGTAIEFCDLFSSSRHLVHVKHRKGGSSSLSHLFAQARVACEALVSDGDFRLEVRQHLTESGSRWARLVPTDKPDPSQYHVVFALIGSNERNPAGQLPFFSQLNLVRTYESLTGFGFNVAVLGVPIASP